MLLNLLSNFFFGFVYFDFMSDSFFSNSLLELQLHQATSALLYKEHQKWNGRNLNLTTHLHPLLSNTAVQSCSFPFLLYILERNSQFSLHIKTDTLLYIPHTAFTNILAIDTVFVNSCVRIFHKARKCVPFYLNSVSRQQAACCFNRCFASNIYCSCSALLYSRIPDYSNFSITNLQWRP